MSTRKMMEVTRPAMIPTLRVRREARREPVGDEPRLAMPREMIKARKVRPQAVDSWVSR